jgi:hypothetical protein
LCIHLCTGTIIAPCQEQRSEQLDPLNFRRIRPFMTRRNALGWLRSCNRFGRLMLCPPLAAFEPRNSAKTASQSGHEYPESR